VALDQRGHGHSDKPDDGYDFATVVEDARSRLTRIAVERPVLVGHSWGANVALAFAAMVQPGPRALVLVDGGVSELSRRMSWEDAAERLRPPNTDMPVERFRERLRERLGVRWSPTWEAAVLGNFWIDVDGTLRRNLSIDNHMRILEHLYHQEVSRLFARVACPILAVIAQPEATAAQPGREDAIRALLAEASQVADVRAVWMPETVHDIPLHRPKELATLIDEVASAAQ
jgi:pimeloyl-ACP methyl ester carboxylesterase